MAFNVTGSQAEGTWLILVTPGGAVKTGVELPATLALEKDNGIFVLASEILHIEVFFLCTEIKAVNAKIFGTGAIGKGPGEERESKVLFSGCTTDLNGVPTPGCTPKDPTDGEGFIVTKFLHALAVLHELADRTKDDVVAVLPDAGETLATIVTGNACPVGNSVPVIGKLAVEDCENLALTHLVKHLVEPFEDLTELWTISKTEEHEAGLFGSAWAKLVGEHVDKQWSISGL